MNTTEGPIYIGKDAEIMEGSMVRGPFAMCNNSVLKMGSKIYDSTTLGPYCKVGGEVNNSVFFGFSSKNNVCTISLGNCVVGELDDKPSVSALSATWYKGSPLR